jgi:hypothetical protein
MAFIVQEFLILFVAAHVRAQKVQTWRYSAAVEPRTLENFT